jgi:hypothetical protein
MTKHALLLNVVFLLVYYINVLLIVLPLAILVERHAEQPLVMMMNAVRKHVVARVFDVLLHRIKSVII